MTRLMYLSLISLTACMNSNEKFDCPAGKGFHCKSVSQVYELSKLENSKPGYKIWIAPFKTKSGKVQADQVIQLDNK